MHEIDPDEGEIRVPVHNREETGRSIRNIAPSRSRVASSSRRPMPEERPRKQRSQKGIWIIASVALVILLGIAAVVLYPSTTVSVTAHTQTVPFDGTIFTIYPAESAAIGTVPYTVKTETFEDSAAVAASGVEHAEEKATGTITVYNEFSADPVKLIKNTRFQSEGGLVFRIPESISVPGKQGSTPGSIKVTVFADQTGEEYNIAAGTLTVPGLKSTPDMYQGVYGRSTEAFAGGFSGDRPAVSQSVLEAARAEVRGRLNEKVQGLVRTTADNEIAFPGLMRISYETLPPTTEGGGSVRIHERAVVHMPVIMADRFAHSIAQAVSASAENERVSIRFSDDTAAQTREDITADDIGESEIAFSLAGQGLLVWNVDATSLAESLAGRDESAFETVIQGFPSVETAEARITPLWRKSFPADPTKISIDVEEVGQF